MFVSIDKLECHNPSLGLMTKARACKGAGQKRSPGVASHALGSVGKCEGMNPHTLKGAPILGVLQRVIAGAKTHWIEVFLISLESFWNVNF